MQDSSAMVETVKGSGDTAGAKFTPGPLTATEATARQATWHVRSRTGVIASVYGATPKADATLYAAAPDLYEALRKAQDLLNYMGDILNGMDACSEEDEEKAIPVFDAVDAALAKAEAR